MSLLNPRIWVHFTAGHGIFEDRQTIISVYGYNLSQRGNFGKTSLTSRLASSLHRVSSGKLDTSCTLDFSKSVLPSALFCIVEGVKTMPLFREMREDHTTSTPL